PCALSLHDALPIYGVGGQDTAKSRKGVCLKRLLVRLFDCPGKCHAAGIRMLYDYESCLSIEFPQQADGRIDVYQVVVREFFAVKLLEKFIEVAIISALLVWIFSISELLARPVVLPEHG